MDVFRTDRIRNVVLLGHGGAGKTTLAEAMAYLAGLTNRLGKVEDGNTVSDYDKEEIKRHFSITTSVIPVPWQKNKVNILDTPGYFDFVGEVEEAVSAADAAIIVVSGKAGVQVGTQKAWNLCEKYKLPRMIFVTDMDVDDVSYRKVVDQLTELYGKKIAPLHFPIREDGKFVGYVNVVKQAGRKYIDKGQKEECAIPSYLDEYLEKYHDILMESVAETSEEFMEEEIKRHFSITTSVIPVPWQKNKVNILDTPGYFDFVGEVEEAVSAADAAIIVVSGKAGVQVGTQKAWNLCEKYKLPRMIFVTDMDVDDVSYRKVVDQLTELYGKKIAPLHFPIREDGKFVGYVNVVKQAGRKYIDKGQKEECAIPSYLDEYLEKYHDILMESVAETSEEFMDRYFEGDEFSVTEVSAALAANIQEASIVPVCMGSPINLRGVSNLLDDICGYFPSPDKRSCNGISQKTNEIFEANYDFAKAKSAYVWKSIVDPFLGKYSLIKVCSGVIKSDDTLLNVEKGTEERLNKLYVLQGSKPIEVPELHAGDIGAIAKLVSVQTGDSLATKANPVLYPKAILSTPYTYKRFKAVNKGDEDKIPRLLPRS